MNSPNIVLIGSPGSGKTSVLKALQGKGYPCFPEIAREITREKRKEGSGQAFLDDPIEFSEELLKRQINQFLKAKQIDGPVFLDRGIPDISTYLDFKKTKYPEYFHLAHLEYRYDKVFFFPFWEEIYELDEERYEDKKTAQKLGKMLRINYKKAGYDLITVPKKSIEERAKFIEGRLRAND